LPRHHFGGQHLLFHQSVPYEILEMSALRSGLAGLVQEIVIMLKL
jgi:hypothetical protein